MMAGSGLSVASRGSEFTDRFAVDMKDKPKDKPSGNHPFDKLCAKRGILHRLIRPYRPQTNGLVERFNRRIGEAIALEPKRGSAKRTFTSHADRDAFLHRFVADYNRARLRCLAYKSPTQVLANLTEHNTFEGVTSDLDLHFERVNASAGHLHLKPLMSVDAWLGLAKDSLRRFDPAAALYIRPMYWAEVGGAGGGGRFDPETTRWCLLLYEAPMPTPNGFSVTLSPYRRPTEDNAPVHAKAGCLYPNNSRAMIEARSRGFGHCLFRDALGNIAELGNANVFMAKDGVVYTPVPNGSLLNCITRQRIIGLLRGSCVTVVEKSLRYADFQDGDEIFSSGNFSKAMPVTRTDERELQPGPFFRKAREAYREFAHS
jgi:branched-chain amino acid aminotransferase